MRILVVEDDPDIREAVRFLIEEGGHEVAVAAHGGLALEALRAGMRPDLVLLDLMMPVMDGRAFLEALRQQPELAGLPVVLMTAQTIRAHELQGARAVLQKPFDPDQLMEMIRRHT